MLDRYLKIQHILLLYHQPFSRYHQHSYLTHQIFSFSPSPQFSKTTKYEEYYGYDQIHEWLSNVNGKTLEEQHSYLTHQICLIEKIWFLNLFVFR